MSSCSVHGVGKGCHKADRQAGDEEHNPFSQWENLERQKEEEMQQKAQKRQTARQAQYVSQQISTCTVDEDRL